MSKSMRDGKNGLALHDPLIKRITAKMRARLPNATAIIFFGSRVAGCADEFSDLDVLVLVPGGVEADERKRLKQEIKAAFPDVEVDLVMGSERWLLQNLRVEAHYRFWLENGIATYGNVPQVDRYPQLYKDALESRLRIIRSEINVVEAWSRNMHREARGYLRILKHLVLIEHALKGDYNDQSIWSDVVALLGKDSIYLLRDPKAVHRVRRTLLLKVRQVVLHKFAQVKKQIIQSHLPTKYPIRELVAA